MPIDPVEMEEHVLIPQEVTSVHVLTTTMGKTVKMVYRWNFQFKLITYVNVLKLYNFNISMDYEGRLLLE